MTRYRTAIFDLDGVLVDTSVYHYEAWKAIARKLGFVLTPEDNELLKGVSRMASMEIVGKLSGKSLPQQEIERLAAEKNALYVQMIHSVSPRNLMPGAMDCLLALKGLGVKTALGSGSKSARFILEKLKLTALFDAIIDGNIIQKAKPDPEIFLKGAQACAVMPKDCVVFEDAGSGVEAAKAASMFAVGVGKQDILKKADLVVRDLRNRGIPDLFR